MAKAQIIIDGTGTWTSPSRKQLRAGLVETSDEQLIREAEADADVYPWLHVIRLDEAPAPMPEPREPDTRPDGHPTTAQEAKDEADTESEAKDPVSPKPETEETVQVTDETSPPNPTGPLTSADLPVAKDEKPKPVKEATPKRAVEQGKKRSKS